MQRISCLLTGFVFILGVTGTECFARPGRRVCLSEVRHRAVPYVESYVQPVYQPYLTTCQGHRLCSTYRTTYVVAYRQAFRRLSQPMYVCCPGWRRVNTHAVGCSKAICRLPCQHGGSCSAPDRCTCPSGWMGKSCQTDVDECTGRSHGCHQRCVNTPGSYRCACQAGQRLSADGKSCHAQDPPPETQASATPALNRSGASRELREDMQALRSRVEVLEQKLQLVLAPFHNLLPSAVEDTSTDASSLLLHTLRQLDRIDSLSEQISFLEERLETCSCKTEH
ncbi:epidermal growth factor-like protein 7 isoform X2 [Carettochelys insculpta]|uniref:epidermal growth factor-like protein 7 isoform X2 n=1 Tax=Carettochelys insculpta TaxID=44489 RepID=UPI003EC0D59C